MTFEEEFLRYKNARTTKEQSIAIKRIDALFWTQGVITTYKNIREALEGSIDIHEFFTRI